MDITTITEILKQATPEMIGGLGSMTIAATFEKIKSLFGDKIISEEEVSEKIKESAENKELIECFANELQQKQIKLTDGKLYIGENVWIGTFNNNTWNLN